MSYDVNKKVVQNIQSLADKAFENHVIVEHSDSELFFRSWLCRNPDRSAYWFRVTCLGKEGALLVSGDLGTMVLQRCEDMVKWASGAANSLQYFAEKVTAGVVRKVSMDAVREEIQEAINELENEPVGDRKRDKMLVDLSDIIERLEDEHPGAVMQAMYDTRYWDGGDFPTCETYDEQFLWRWCAVKKWLSLIEPKPA